MAKRNNSLPSALDAAIEPGLVNPTAQSLNQSPSTAPAPSTPGTFDMTPQQVAGAKAQTAADQSNVQAAQNNPTTAPSIDYTDYNNFHPTYSGDGGFNSSAPANSMDALQVFSGGRVPTTVRMDRRFGPGAEGTLTAMNRYELVTGTTMMQRYMTLAQNDPSQFKALQSQLVDGGWGLTKKYADGIMNTQTVAALQNLLQTASRYNDPTVTPDALLKRSIDNSSASGSGSGGTNSTSTNYNFTSPMAATYYGNQAAQQDLGRNLNPQESQQFYSALHSAEQANPQVSTTTYGEDPNSGMPIAEKSTDKSVGFASYSGGGVAETQLAQDYAQTRGDYAETQAATTLMDEVFKMLGGKV